MVLEQQLAAVGMIHRREGSRGGKAWAALSELEAGARQCEEAGPRVPEFPAAPPSPQGCIQPGPGTGR